MFLESLRDKEVNYNHANDLDSNQDYQCDQECHPNVFWKETGDLVDLFYLKSHKSQMFIKDAQKMENPTWVGGHSWSSLLESWSLTWL